MISSGQPPTLPRSTAAFSCSCPVLVQAIPWLARSQRDEYFHGTLISAFPLLAAAPHSLLWAASFHEEM